MGMTGCEVTVEEVLAEFSSPMEAVGWQVALLRLLAALLLGGLIGWEREARHKPAGLRTHMMVCLAACLFTLLTLEIVELDLTDGQNVRTDPIRVIEAITSGVAFLAAGTILVNRDKVRGLTTGAGLWLAGAIGVACGLGRITLAGMAAVLTLVILWLLRRVFLRMTSKADTE